MSYDLHRVEGPLREVRTNDPDHELLLVPDVLTHVEVPTSCYPSHRLHPSVTAARALALLAAGWIPRVPTVRDGEYSWGFIDRNTAMVRLHELDAVQRAIGPRTT